MKMNQNLMVHILKKTNGEVIVIGKIKGINMNLLLKNRIIKARLAFNSEENSDNNFISFKKSQKFYVLSYNKNDQTYKLSITFFKKLYFRNSTYNLF